MGKEPTTSDEIVGGVELEKEGLTWIQGLEDTTAAGLPEIDFVDPWLLGKKGEPFIVSYANETFHPVYPFPEYLYPACPMKCS